MGRIVTAGRGVQVTPAGVNTVNGRRSGQKQLRLSTNMDGQKISLDLGRKAKADAALADVTLIREHFGVNTSEALRVSLHLTANAIRANTAKVTLP